MAEIKQVIVVREDLNLSRGKTAAQAAHASLQAWKNAGDEIRERWEREGGKKVVVESEDEEQLFRLKEDANNLGLPTALITDRGYTEVDPGTKTALAIGPAETERIDKVTGSLPLME